MYAVAFNAPLEGAGQRRYDDGLRGLSVCWVARGLLLLLALLTPHAAASHYNVSCQNSFAVVAFFTSSTIDFVLEMIAAALTIY